MDDLLREFLTETNESLDVVDVELVRFEQEPNNAEILGNIFRLVHTIKGTCGFLGLPRLEALAHAAETLMGKFRDGMPVTGEAVTLILSTIDRIKDILDALERDQREPDGADADLIAALEQMVRQPTARRPRRRNPVGTLAPQVLERPLRRAKSRSTNSSARSAKRRPDRPPAPQAAVGQARGAEPAADEDDDDGDKVGSQSIRVTVDTLEHLMTMVSELVLTRNQLLEIVRRHDESEFKVPLQRLSNVTAELQEGVMKTRMQPIGNAWQKLPRIVRDLSRRARQADRARDARRRDRARPPGARSDQGSAHPHGAQLGRSRPRDAGRAARRRQARDAARIRLSAYHEGGHIIIEIADDGRGLDTERIKAKALAQRARDRGRAREDDGSADPQVHLRARLLDRRRRSPACPAAASAWTWCATISIRSAAPSTCKSVPGEGSSFTIKIPLTLAIVSALIVRGRRRALRHPAARRGRAGARAHGKSEHRIERIKDTAGAAAARQAAAARAPQQRCSKLDGDRATPEKRLHRRHPGRQRRPSASWSTACSTPRKSWSSRCRASCATSRMFSGNTILGDGSVIMIIDPNGIAQAIGSVGRGAVAAAQADARSRAPSAAEKHDVAAGVPRRLAAAEGGAAVAGHAARGDRRTKIELSNGRHMVQYRGQLMPLVRVSDERARSSARARSRCWCSPTAAARWALVVDEIVDIVEDRLDIQVASDQRRRARLGRRQGPGDRDHRRRPFPAARLRGLVPRQGRARDAPSAARVLLVDDSPFFRNMLTPVLQGRGLRRDRGRERRTRRWR